VLIHAKDEIPKPAHVVQVHRADIDGTAGHVNAVLSHPAVLAASLPGSFLRERE
jgi:hypothetical protein